VVALIHHALALDHINLAWTYDLALGLGCMQLAPVEVREDSAGEAKQCLGQRDANRCEQVEVLDLECVVWLLLELKDDRGRLGIRLWLEEARR